MAEEFQESDVIFSDEYDSSSSSSSSGHNIYEINFNNQKAKKKHKKRQKSGSIPIHIPKNVTIYSDDLYEDDHDLPPHLIVAKRIDQGMAFSMKSGALKGRELSEFRNSILRMTGFLET